MLSDLYIPFSRSPVRQAHLSLRREAQARRALAVVENGVHRLEEDVAEDAEADASVRLDTTEASRAAIRDGGEVDVAARNRERLAADGDIEVGQVGAARVDVAGLLLVEARTLDLSVVGLGDCGREVEEGSAGVGDGGADGAGGGVVAADGVATGGELPEALAVVNGYVGDAAAVFGAVDVAEGVAAGLSLLQVDGEERFGQCWANRVEEGFLGLRLNSVDYEWF